MLLGDVVVARIRSGGGERIPTVHKAFLGAVQHQACDIRDDALVALQNFAEHPLQEWRLDYDAVQDERLAGVGLHWLLCSRSGLVGAEKVGMLLRLTHSCNQCILPGALILSCRFEVLGNLVRPGSVLVLVVLGIEVLGLGAVANRALGLLILIVRAVVLLFVFVFRSR